MDSLECDILHDYWEIYLKEPLKNSSETLEI